MDRFSEVVTTSLLRLREAYFTLMQAVHHFRLNIMGVLQGPDVDIPDITLPQIFDNQFTSEKFSSRTALVHNGKTLTFAELKDESEVFAWNLTKLFSTEDYSVKGLPKVFGLFTVPATPRIVSLIGLLKLKHAYLPIDFTQPFERIAVTLQDSGVRHILYDDEKAKAILQKLQEKIHDIIPIDINYLLIHDSEIDFSALNIRKDKDPLVAVLYTSGSTGIPKGVPVFTSRLLNRLLWQWNEAPFTEDDIGCHKTSLLFSDSLTELFGCLFKGVPLIVLSRSVANQPEQFITAIKEHQISRLVLVPSLLEMMISYLKTTKDLDKVFSIRTVISSGEGLPLKTTKEFFSMFPLRSVLYNLYGSSETTGDVTFNKWESLEDVEASSMDGFMSIGIPMYNTCVVLLNEENEPCKEGTVGGVYVSGANIIPGYLNTTELNLKAFIHNKVFSKDYHGTLFRMGDLGLVRNGKLYFRGRSDSQVKIGGHRVDLQEIDLIVKAIPGIDSCRVLPYRDTKGYIVPVVFYTSNGGKVDIDKKIKFECEKRLQKYSIPRCCKVDMFPIQPHSGKVDRQKLLSMFRDRVLDTGLKDSASAADTQAENILKMLARNLSVPQEDLRLNMSFFENGGNSLTVVAMVSDLNSEGIEIGLSQLLTFKTLQELLDFNWGSCKEVSINCSLSGRYQVVMLNSVPNKDEAIPIIAQGFSKKNPLDLLAGTSVHSIERLIRSFWKEIFNDDLSVVIVDKSKMSIIGVTLSLDLSTEIKAVWDKPEVCQINEMVEEPVRRKLLKGGGKWADSLLAAIDPDLPDDLGLSLLEVMTEYSIKVIQNKGYDGICEVNSHPVTMALAEERFGFITMNSLHVKSFCYLGKYPFKDAEDTYVIKTMVKHLK